MLFRLSDYDCRLAAWPHKPWSAVALDNIASMAVSGLYTSYLIVAVLLLYRRCPGDIAAYGENDENVINVPSAPLVWEPFRVPDIWHLGHIGEHLRVYLHGHSFSSASGPRR